MSQYQNVQPQPYGAQFAPNAASFQQPNNWLSPSMAPPQQTAPPTAPAFHQPSSPSLNPSGAANFRASPYYVPQRPQVHQRSASIQLPHAPSPYDASAQPASATAAAQAAHDRRMSLPAHSFENPPQADPATRSSVSSTSSPSAEAFCASPASAADPRTPYLHTGVDTPTSLPFAPMDYSMNSQVLGSNPLSFSLPPESQQLFGSALDVNDPRTAMLMAGSENLAQPFAPTYTYNPNYSSKMNSAANAGSTMTLTLPQKAMKLESSTPPTSISEGLYSTESFLTPGNEGYGAFFDFQSTDFGQSGDEQGSNEQFVDDSNFVNWD